MLYRDLTRKALLSLKDFPGWAHAFFKGKAGAPAAREDAQISPLRLMLNHERMVQQVREHPALGSMFFGFQDAVSDQCCLPAREEMVERIRASFGAWSLEPAGPVAMVGSRGTGLSTLMSQCVRWLSQDGECVRITTDRRMAQEKTMIAHLSGMLQIPVEMASARELAQHINEGGRRCIIIDDLDRYLFRDAAGGACQALFALITATAGRILWIVSSSDQAWQRADYLLDAHDYFEHVITVPACTREEFDALMRSRLVVPDGAALEIETRDGYEAVETRQAWESPLFLDWMGQLFSVSGGAIKVAAARMLGQAAYDVQTNTVRLQRFLPIDYRCISGQDMRITLALTEIMVHGGLSLAELSLILRLETSFLQPRLMRLVNQGILDVARLDYGEIYSIGILHHGKMLGQLTSAHTLY